VTTTLAINLSPVSTIPVNKKAPEALTPVISYSPVSLAPAITFFPGVVDIGHK
jgi:hypothetical protein